MPLLLGCFGQSFGNALHEPERAGVVAHMDFVSYKNLQLRFFARPARGCVSGLLACRPAGPPAIHRSFGPQLGPVIGLSLLQLLEGKTHFLRLVSAP